jgi:hypothetical protein
MPTAEHTVLSTGQWVAGLGGVGGWVCLCVCACVF